MQPSIPQPFECPLSASPSKAEAPARDAVESWIRNAYARAYDAAIDVDYPVLISLQDAAGEIVAAAGYRRADSGALFLEQYTREPVEKVMSRLSGQAISRGRILIESIDRSTRMVEQLLAFSRLQHMDMPFAPVDIGELVSDAVRELAPQAMRDHRDIKADITPGIEVTGAAAALAVLIRNLIDNALKHSPAGTTIGVTVTREQGWPVFVVSDSGPGIPTELQERVFDRFYRIPRVDDGDNGSGLGLAMVRWIADMHKAEVRLENLQPRGLRVKVLFKTRRHPP